MRKPVVGGLTFCLHVCVTAISNASGRTYGKVGVCAAVCLLLLVEGLTPQSAADDSQEEDIHWREPCNDFYSDISDKYVRESAKDVADYANTLFNEYVEYKDFIAKLHSYSSYKSLSDDYAGKEWLRSYPYWKDGQIDRTDLVLPKGEEYLLDEKTKTTVNEMKPEDINRALPFLAKAMKMLGRSLSAVSDSLDGSQLYDKPLKDKLKYMSTKMCYLLCLTFAVIKSRGLEMLPLYDSQVLVVLHGPTEPAFLVYRDTINFLHYVEVFFDAMSSRKEKQEAEELHSPIESATGDNIMSIKVNGMDIKYIFVDEFLTWHQSKELCATAGMELWTPVDEAEANEMWNLLSKEDHFLSALPLGWGTGEPDYGGVKHGCLKVQGTALYMGDCDRHVNEHLYVCKQSNQIAVANGTYKFYKEKASWWGAIERCAGAGAQLWTPGDEAEQRAVRSDVNRHITQPIWTGINDLHQNGVFRALDGWPLIVDKNRWRSGELINHTQSHCMALESDSLLFHESCYNELPYVCKILAENENFSIAPISPLEKAFKIRSKDGSVHVYQFHDDIVVTWQQARENCSIAGAQLWTPEDEVDARMMRRKLRHVNRYWILWTGINDLDNLGDYKNYDGRPISAIHHRWDAGQPNSYGGTQRCVMLRTDSALTLSECNFSGPYVCKFPVVSGVIDSTPAAPSYTSLQDPGESRDIKFTLNFDDTNIYYVFHNDSVTWDQAKKLCSDQNSQLLVAANDEEARLVRLEVDRYIPSSLIWTAINDLDNNEKRYHAPNGQRFEEGHHRWGPGEPNQWSSEPFGTFTARHCTAMWSDTALYNVDCAWSYPYVCTSSTHGDEMKEILRAALS